MHLALITSQKCVFGCLGDRGNAPSFCCPVRYRFTTIFGISTACLAVYTDVHASLSFNIREISFFLQYNVYFTNPKYRINVCICMCYVWTVWCQANEFAINMSVIYVWSVPTYVVQVLHWITDWTKRDLMKKLFINFIIQCTRGNNTFVGILTKMYIL